ncbi:MAG: hypothetical protein RQ745_12790 [Longimicrobiales bacterium]|nr:hypothetical protein [Longimicrobiales bacterium]
MTRGAVVIVGVVWAVSACANPEPGDTTGNGPRDDPESPLELTRILDYPAGGADPYPPWTLVTDAAIWGDDLVVADVRSPGVYEYDLVGSFVRTLGGEGAGPGEYESPRDIVPLPSGRLVVWDPGNARVLSYHPDGSSTSFRVHSTTYFASVRTLFSIGDSLILIRARRERDDGAEYADGTHLLVYSLAGELVDTMLSPRIDAPALAAPQEALFGSAVPFAPTVKWIVTETGEVVATTGESYEVLRLTPDGDTLGVVRRDDEPVRIDPGEREAWKAAMEFAARRRDPSWSWPRSLPFPETKPVISGLRPVVGGGFAVLLHGRGVEFPELRREGAVHWGEARQVDVYSSAGSWIGSIRLPAEEGVVRISPTHVVTRLRDALDRTYLRVYALASGE